MDFSVEKKCEWGVFSSFIQLSLNSGFLVLFFDKFFHNLFKHTTFYADLVMLIFVGTTSRPQLRNIAKELIFRDKGTFYFGDHKEKSRIWDFSSSFLYNLMQKKTGMGQSRLYSQNKNYSYLILQI